MKYEESFLHRQCVVWIDGYFKRNFPELMLKQTDKNGMARTVAPIHHSASERKTSPQAGRRLKDLAQRAGFPDLYLPIPAGGYQSLAIELKSKTGRQSINQKHWQEFFAKANVQYFLCRSIEEFQQIVISYLHADKNRVK